MAKVHQLALTSHLGQPMVGIWDWAGSLVRCARGGRPLGRRMGAWASRRGALRAAAPTYRTLPIAPIRNSRIDPMMAQPIIATSTVVSTWSRRAWYVRMRR